MIFSLESNRLCEFQDSWQYLEKVQIAGTALFSFHSLSFFSTERLVYSLVPSLGNQVPNYYC